MMIDITDSTNMAQVFGFLPLPWMTGNTLGQGSTRCFVYLILMLNDQLDLSLGVLCPIQCTGFPDCLGNRHF
jgi:hypothetical protein